MAASRRFGGLVRRKGEPHADAKELRREIEQVEHGRAESASRLVAIIGGEKRLNGR